MTGSQTTRLRGPSLLLVAVFASALGSVPGLAHESPPGCDGDGVNVTLTRSPSGAVPVGGVVTYTVAIRNLSDSSVGLIACDADDVDVVFHCPGADGTPDTSTPVVLTTNLSLPADTPTTVLGMPTCTLDVNPGVTDAQASVVAGDQEGPIDDLSQGRLHDAVVDHPFRSQQQIGLDVVPATTTSTAVTTTTTSTNTTPTTGVPQPVVCRPPGFWALHADDDPQRPRTRDIAAAFLPVTVCGVVLTNTDVGNSCSAQEALCVAPRADQRLELARELTAARLNCNVRPCPTAVLALLDACEAACVTNAVPEAVGDCIEDVHAFNGGSSPDAPDCRGEPIPGVGSGGPAGSARDCQLARSNDRGDHPVTIFSGDACP